MRLLVSGRSETRRLHRLEVPEHPIGVRLAPGEQAEGSGSLEDRHAASRHHAAPARPRFAQELRLEREVDDVGNPEPWTKKLSAEGCARIPCHAQRGGID